MGIDGRIRRIARAITGADETDRGPYEERWTGDGEDGVGGSRIYDDHSLQIGASIPRSLSGGVVEIGYGKSAVAVLREVADNYRLLAFDAERAEEGLSKAADAIASSKYARISVDENPRVESGWITVTMEATDEAYKEACEEFDRVYAELKADREARIAELEAKRGTGDDAAIDAEIKELREEAEIGMDLDDACRAGQEKAEGLFELDMKAILELL